MTMSPLRKNLRHQHFVIVFTSLFSCLVNAQDQTQDEIFLNEILITGSRNESTAGELPVKSDVITGKNVDAQITNDIQTMTRYTPGVEVGGSAGSRFGLSGFTIRGIGGDRVKIMVDGIDQANDFDFGPFLSSRRDYFEIESLKAAEIIRGPASALYGSDALGGIVGFRTKDPNDFFETNDDESYAGIKTAYRSSDDSFANTLSLANRTGNLESLLIYTHRNGHEQETHSSADITGPSRPSANPSDFDSDNVLTKFNYQLNPDNRLGLTFEHYNIDEQFDILSNTGRSASNIPNVPPILIDTLSNTADDEKKRKRLSLELESNSTTALFDKSLTKLSWQDSESNQITEFDRLVSVAGSPFLPQQRFRDSEYEETGYFFDQQFDKFIYKGSTVHQLTYGLDLKKIDSKSLRQVSDRSFVPTLSNEELVRDFPTSEIQEYAIYLQDNIEFGNFRLIPGVRYDYYEFTPSVDDLYLNSNPIDRNPDSFDEDSLSFKLGGVWNINSNWSLFAQYAEGFKSPQADQIFGEFQNPQLGYQIIANPDLTPEKSRGVDFGIRMQNSFASFETTAFYTKFNDFIEQASFFDPRAGLLTFQFQNREEAEIKGLEFKGELSLAQFSDALNGFKLRASAAYARGDGNDENEPERPLNSIAPFKFVTSLSYDSPSEKWGSELFITAVERKDRINDTDDESLFATPGFATTDLSFYYNITDKLRLNAGIFNLSDKKYWLWEDVRGLSLSERSPELDRFTQPGRNYALSLSWEF